MEKVQQALIQQFLTFDGGAGWTNRIAWENVAFTPPQGGLPWFAFYFMPVDERIATLGPTGLDEAQGMVQITVAYPIGVGEANSRETINKLRTCFRPGVLQYDSQGVTILSRSRSNGRTVDGFYKIPFTVRWRAQLKR